MPKRRWMRPSNSQQCSSNSGSNSCKRRGRSWGSRGNRRQARRQQNPPLLRDDSTAAKISGVMSQLHGDGIWPRGLASPGYFDQYLPSSGCIHHDWSRDVLLQPSSHPEVLSAADIDTRKPGATAAACATLTAEPTQSLPANMNASLTENLTCEVNIRIQKPTAFGQRVCLVGSSQQLGGWAVASSLSLSWSEGHWWQATARLPPGTHEFKAVVLSGNSTGAPIWESGVNRTLEVPATPNLPTLTYTAHWQQPPLPTPTPTPAPATPTSPPLATAPTTPAPGKSPLPPHLTRTYTAALHSLALFSAPPPTTLDIGASDWQAPPPPGSTPADLLLLMVEAARLSRHPAVITRQDAEFVRRLGLGTCNLPPPPPPSPTRTPASAALARRLPPGHPSPANPTSPTTHLRSNIAPWEPPTPTTSVLHKNPLATPQSTLACPQPQAPSAAPTRTTPTLQRAPSLSTRTASPTGLRTSSTDTNPRGGTHLSPRRALTRSPFPSGPASATTATATGALPLSPRANQQRRRVISESVASSMRALSTTEGGSQDKPRLEHTIGPLSALDTVGRLSPEQVPGGCEGLCRVLLGRPPLQQVKLAGSTDGSTPDQAASTGRLCTAAADGINGAGCALGDCTQRQGKGQVQVAARLVAEHLGLGGQALSVGDEARLGMVLDSFGALAGSAFVPQHIGPLQYSSWLVRRGGGAAAGVWHAAVKCALAPLVEGVQQGPSA